MAGRYNAHSDILPPYEVGLTRTRAKPYGIGLDVTS